MNNIIEKASFNPEFFLVKGYVEPDEVKNFHYHDSFEIYLALSDGDKYYVNDKVYPIIEGDLFVFNYKDIHKPVFLPTMVHHNYVIHFMPSYVQDFSTPETDLLACFTNRGPDFSHRLHLNYEQFQALLPVLKKAEFYYFHPVFGHEIYTKILLVEILLLVNSFYHTTTSSSSESKDSEYIKIKPIIDYINEHIEENLSLASLANNFYINKNYLSHLFKKTTGHTVNEYIISRKIILAKELLRKNLPVIQVAKMSGFNDYSNFIRTFKKYAGITPKQFIKQS